MVISRSLLICAAVIASTRAADATVRLHDNVVVLGGARAVITGTVSPRIHVRARITVGAAKIDVAATGSLSDLDAKGELRVAGLHVPFTARADLSARRLVAFSATVVGAEVVADPVTWQPDGPTELALHVRGLDLARIVPARVIATGTLDGELAIRIDRDGASLHDGTLRARGPGLIHVTDTRWLPTGDGLEPRLAATLANFSYAQLAIDLAPRGSDPDVRVAIHGHGTANDQALDLTVNLHGARHVAQRLAPHVWRSS